MRAFLCKLGFHTYEKITGMPGVFFFYWREKCKHCPAERTYSEAMR